MKAAIAYTLALMAGISYGQQNMLLNGDFESVPTTGCQAINPTVSESPSNFNNNINNWQAAEHSNGASSIGSSLLGEALLIDLAQCGSGSTFNSGVHSCSAFPSIIFTGTKFALIRANYETCTSSASGRTHGAIGQALFNGSVFDNGVTYIVRYKIVAMGSRNKDTNGGAYCSGDNDGGLLCHMRFFLSENPPHTWNNSNSSQQELYSVSYQEQCTRISGTDLTPCAWRQVEREFTCNSGIYTSLIIYAESGGAAIDDVEIFEKCENNKYIQNKVYTASTGAYSGMGFNLNEQAGTTLVAGNNVNTSMTQGDVVLGNYTKANFTAGNSINLLDGFFALNGTEFAAVPLGCPNTLNRTIAPANENPDPNYIKSPPMQRDEDAIAEKQLIKQLGLVQSRVFPNPTNNTFTYQASAIKSGSRFTITNVFNQLFLEKTAELDLKEINFDISSLSKGIYFLNHYTKESILVATNKIVKE